MRNHLTLIPTLRGMAAGTLFVVSMGSGAQTPAATSPAAPSAEALSLAFQRADANGDGKLSKDESARLPEVAEKFDVLDKDRDGFLSMTEFTAGFVTPK